MASAHMGAMRLIDRTMSFKHSSSGATDAHLNPFENGLLEFGLLGDEVFLAQVQQIHRRLGSDERMCVEELGLLHVPVRKPAGSGPLGKMLQSYSFPYSYIICMTAAPHPLLMQ